MLNNQFSIFNSELPIGIFHWDISRLCRHKNKNNLRGLMKNLFVSALVVLLFVNPAFASQQKIVKPTLKSAKVFTNGAQLSYAAEVKLNKGINEVILTDLADNIDRNSVTAAGRGDAVILSVVQRFDYLELPQKDPLVKALEDSLELLNNLIDTKKIDSEVLGNEQDLILSNKQLGGKEGKVSVAELQNMAAFYRKRLSEIKNDMHKIDIEIKKIQKAADRIKKQLDDLKSKINQRTNQLVVTLSAESQVNFGLDVSCIITNAGWTPYYDIRVPNISSKADLAYKANVWQKSGYDWKDIDIILSTRSPYQNNQKPELNPWFINFLEPRALSKSIRGQNMEKLSMPDIAVTEAKDEAQTMANYMNINQTQLAVEFSPSMKFSIPSDGKPYSIDIQNYELPADYEYYAAPKLDDNAFLVGNLKQWSNYNLLPGSANIYFENSYVGKTYLNPFTAQDSLAISLGRDQSVILSKNLLKDFSDNKFLSSNVERTFAYEIKIKNNKTVPVKISVEDQIPLSKNEDIEVKLIDSSGAIYNAETGLLRWNVELKPGGLITKRLMYSVTYPKDKEIPNL